MSNYFKSDDQFILIEKISFDFEKITVCFGIKKVTVLDISTVPLISFEELSGKATHFLKELATFFVTEKRCRDLFIVSFVLLDAAVVTDSPAKIQVSNKECQTSTQEISCG